VVQIKKDGCYEHLYKVWEARLIHYHDSNPFELHNILFECNTNWVEIQRELLPGQKWFDRPDLVCRGTFVSHQKNVLSFQAKDGYAAEGFE